MTVRDNEGVCQTERMGIQKRASSLAEEARQTSDKALHFKRDAGFSIVRDRMNEATSLLIF